MGPILGNSPSGIAWMVELGGVRAGSEIHGGV